MTHLGICTLRKQGNNASEHYDSLSLLIKNSSHEQPHVMKLNRFLGVCGFTTEIHHI